MICTPEFIRVYNETFKFIHEKLGYEAVVEYWKRIALMALEDLEDSLVNGLKGAGAYWTKVLDAEDGIYAFGGDCVNEMTLNIIECPSLKILGDGICEFYCDHCTIMYQPIFEGWGYDYKVERKDKGCRIRITRRKSASLATEATPAPAST